MIKMPEKKIIVRKLTTVQITSPQGQTKSISWGEGEVSTIAHARAQILSKDFEEVLDRLHEPDIIGHVMQGGTYAGWHISGVATVVTHKADTGE